MDSEWHAEIRTKLPWWTNEMSQVDQVIGHELVVVGRVEVKWVEWCCAARAKEFELDRGPFGQVPQGRVADG